MSPSVRLGSFYASIFLGVGVFMTFVPVHLRSLGLSATTITAVFAARQAFQALTPPAWGVWADRRGSGRLPILCAAALSALLFAPLIFLDNAILVGALLILQAGAVGALVPLADSMTLTVLKDRADRFGRIRLAGSAAFGVGILVFSSLINVERVGINMADAARVSIPINAAILAAAAVVALLLPPVARKKLQKWSVASETLHNRTLWILLAAGACHWAAHSPYVVMFGVHLQDQGHAPIVPALALCHAVGIEVLVMFAAPRFLGRVSTMTLLRITFVVGVLRWVLTAFVSHPALIILIQGLHGLTFGMFYVVAISAVHNSVPEQMRSTGQTVFTSAVFGLGGIVGTLLAGVAYERGGSEVMFLLSAVLDVVAVGMSLVPVGRGANPSVPVEPASPRR